MGIHSIGSAKRIRWQDLSREDQEWLKKEHPVIALDLIFTLNPKDEDEKERPGD